MHPGDRGLVPTVGRSGSVLSMLASQGKQQSIHVVDHQELHSFASVFVCVAYVVRHMMAGLYSSYAPEPDSIGTNFSRGTYTCCFGNFGSCAFSCGCSPLRHPGAFSRVRRRRVGPLGLPPRVRIWLRVRHVGPLCPFLHLRPRLFSTSDACAVPMFVSVIARSLGCDGDSLPVKS